MPSLENDFGVAGGIEDCPVFFVVLPEQGGIDEIAVVRDGDLAPEVDELADGFLYITVGDRQAPPRGDLEAHLRPAWPDRRRTPR